MSTMTRSHHEADGGEDADDGGDQVEGADDEGAGLQGGAAAKVLNFWQSKIITHICQQIFEI